MAEVIFSLFKFVIMSCYQCNKYVYELNFLTTFDQTEQCGPIKHFDH